MNAEEDVPTVEVEAQWDEKPSAIQLVNVLAEAVRSAQWASGHGKVSIFGLALPWHFSDSDIDEARHWLANELASPSVGAALRHFSYAEDNTCGGSRIEATITT